MKKTFSRFLLCLLSLCLCLALVACNSPVADPNDEITIDETEESTVTDAAATDDEDTDEEATKEDESDEDKEIQSIDIYLIAGQSNAAGYTLYARNTLANLWSRCQVGSPNVLYIGSADSTANVNTANVSTIKNEVKHWTTAHAGQGKGESYIGTEVGMAKILAEKYYKYDAATNEDKVAGIIKFAHGGTSLFNNTSGENAADGNWVPPSYAQQKGWTYSGLTGGLYRKLLAQVESGIEKLADLGYNDIHIKGLFWMQGEADRGNPAEYEIALNYFIDDIRRDLGEIVNEDLSDMAIMIGEISETAGSAEAATVATNRTFIEMQRRVAAARDNVYVIASGKYHVNWLENGVNKNAQDAWHWSTSDIFHIGVEVGECILDHVLGVKE